MKESVPMRVLTAIVVALLLAAPAMARPAAAPYSEGFVQQLANLINSYRQQQGLEPLALADELAALASEHSVSMSAQQQLSHQGFDGRFRGARSRVCVENVAWNHRTPEGMLEGWLRSPGHQRNLVDPAVSRMGLAFSTRYVTFFACR